jgi:hypothetical protein
MKISDSIRRLPDSVFRARRSQHLSPLEMTLFVPDAQPVGCVVVRWTQVATLVRV